MPIKITDNTKDVLRKVHGLTNDGKRDFAQKVKDIAKEESPNVTGNNASEIEFDEPKEGSFRVFTQSNYGGYLEFGTSRMAAQPYFRPAINIAISEFQDEGKWGE